MMNPITIYILIIVFIATLIRSTFGFGESLIAVPLLIFFVPIEIAVPFSVLLSIAIAAVVVVQDHQQIHFSSAKWLIIFAIPGIPVGLFILVHGTEHLVKIGLGLLIVLYSMYSLVKQRSPHARTDSMAWLFVCGFLSGVFGGAYGLNGPPLVVYGNMRNWSARHFRATLQAYFLPVSIIGMLGYWYKGLWTSAVTHYFLVSIPVIIPTIFLGRFLNHRLKDGHFFKYVHFGLIVVGAVLLVQSF
jgi:uncharacterized membrane protein YfcA